MFEDLLGWIWQLVEPYLGYLMWGIAGLFSLYIGREVLIYAIEQREERETNIYYENIRKNEEERRREVLEQNRLKLQREREERERQILRDIVKVPSINESEIGFDVSDLVRNNADLLAPQIEPTLDANPSTLGVQNPFNEVKPIVQEPIRWKLEDELGTKEPIAKIPLQKDEVKPIDKPFINDLSVEKHEIARPEPIKEIIEEPKPKYDIRYNPRLAYEYSQRGYRVQLDFIDYLSTQGYEIIEHYETEKYLPDIVARKQGQYYVYSVKSWKCDIERLKAGCNARTLYRKDIEPEINKAYDLMKQGKKVNLLLVFHNPLTNYWEIEKIKNINVFSHYTTSARFGSVS